MGKAKKLKHLKAMRNVPLDQQIDEENSVKTNDRKRFKKNNDNEESNQMVLIVCVSFSLIVNLFKLCFNSTSIRSYREKYWIRRKDNKQNSKKN